MSRVIIILGVLLILIGWGVGFVSEYLDDLQDDFYAEERGDFYIEGEIVDSNGRVLVAEGVRNEEFDGSIDSLLGNAGWFNVDSAKIVDIDGNLLEPFFLEKGMLVRVWSTGEIMESYPVQGTASKLQIVKEKADREIDRDSNGDIDVEKSCYTGGCSGEICSDDPEAVSTCELLPGMECLKEDMECALFEGECKWVLGESAARCFMEIVEREGREVKESRIGYLFEKAEAFFGE